LILRGSLPTHYLKQVAQELVSHIEGVDAVVNQIKVAAGESRAAVTVSHQDQPGFLPRFDRSLRSSTAGIALGAGTVEDE